MELYAARRGRSDLGESVMILENTRCSVHMYTTFWETNIHECESELWGQRGVSYSLVVTPSRSLFL